jgi:hypothetical protein
VSVSVAMTDSTDSLLAQHLLRDDGDEDVCLARYSRSTGQLRTTALLRAVDLPLDGERYVHGTASFTGEYILRVATLAAQAGEGIALLHSHPRGKGWQRLSTTDAETEQAYALMAQEITGLPLVGLTLAGRDRHWSARSWSGDGEITWCENVRVVGSQLRVSWNDELRPAPVEQTAQGRTVSCWGPVMQANIARLRVLVVGVGSVGLDVALRLAATGIEVVSVMDFDRIEEENRDRMIGVAAADVGRLKVDVAHARMLEAATASTFLGKPLNDNVCRTDALRTALDFDVIFSCVDRPWPRAVLNSVAYADLVPVIDGGIGIDPEEDGSGMRGATWRTHVLRPGRPCAICNLQLDPSLVALDQAGLLTPKYIEQAGLVGVLDRQNVAALCASVSASLLAQFVSLTVAPGGQGEPGPLRFQQATHWLEHMTCATRAHCILEQHVACGDERLVQTRDFEIHDNDQGDSAGDVRSRKSLLARVIDWLSRLRASGS